MWRGRCTAVPRFPWPPLDELIDDTRNFVRNSPGIALAGAAVVGFVVARLVKSGLARDDEDDDA